MGGREEGGKFPNRSIKDRGRSVTRSVLLVNLLILRFTGAKMGGEVDNHGGFTCGQMQVKICMSTSCMLG